MEHQSEQLCLELGALPEGESREAFLRAHPQMLSGQTVADLADLIRTTVRVDLRKAGYLAEAAVSLAATLHDDEMLGLALRSKANTVWFMGDCRSAVPLFNQAADLLERAGNLSEVARTLSSSIQSRSLLGEYEDAYEAANKARQIFRSLGDHWRLARLELNVANILHRQNRYGEAMRAYEHAYGELLPHKDQEGIGVALHNVAVCLIALDDYENALQVSSRVRELCADNNMPQLVGQAEYNIAYLHHLRGEYSRALELLRTTREKCAENGDHYHLGLCDLDASAIYLELNLVSEAADAATHSLKQFQALGTNYEIVRSQLNLALALSRTGKLDRALSLFTEARDSAVREENEVLPALIDLQSSTALLGRSRFEDALQLCLRAQPIFQQAALASYEVTCSLLLGRIRLSSGDLQQAADHCETALRILNDLDAPALLYQAQFLQGQIHEANGNVLDAYRYYQAARSTVESLRSGLRSDELKIGFMRDHVGVYNRLTQLCLARGSSAFEEAFSYVEASKSRTLQNLIFAGSRLKEPDPANDETTRDIEDLKSRLTWYYNLLERQPYSADRISRERLDQLRTQSLQCERELRRLMLESSPSSSEELGAPDINSVSELRRQLGQDSTLLEYFSIDGQIYTTVLSANQMVIKPIANASDIAPTLSLLQFQLSKFRLDPAYARHFLSPLLRSIQAHLKSLYDKLIAPIVDILKTHKLAIVPCGQLYSLPFHALFDGERYLVDRFSISFAPSATVFAYAQCPRPLTATSSSLIVGIDDPGMPSVKEEVDAVAQILPNPKVLWGAEATKAKLRDYGSGSTLIHIAAHGEFRVDNPMFSSIRMADGRLTLYDLYRMRLPAEFLALSGCVTGLNAVDEGDELTGLTRGLLYAGARSLLLSLWDVDDACTTRFMRGFYTELGCGSSNSDALRLAALQIRSEFPHPYFWAPFRLTGAVLKL